jgi:hypothetical protein
MTMQIDGDGFGQTVERALEGARAAAGTMDRNQVIERLQTGPGGTVRWFDDETRPQLQLQEFKAPSAPKLAAPAARKVTTTISM